MANPKKNLLLMAGISLLVVLLSLGSLGWAVYIGLIRELDGLLLAMVCLLGVLIFGVQFLLLIKRAGLFDSRKGDSPEIAGNTSATAPKESS